MWQGVSYLLFPAGEAVWIPPFLYSFAWNGVDARMNFLRMLECLAACSLRLAGSQRDRERKG